VQNMEDIDAEAWEDFKDMIFQGLMVIFVAGSVSLGFTGDFFFGAIMSFTVWINTIIIIE